MSELLPPLGLALLIGAATWLCLTVWRPYLRRVADAFQLNEPRPEIEAAKDWKDMNAAERRGFVIFLLVASIVWLAMSVFLVTGPDVLGGLKAMADAFSGKPYSGP